MKNCLKWGGLIALLLVSVSVLGAGYTYEVNPGGGDYKVIRIHNDTGGSITSVLVVFEDSVVVDKALAYGKVAPAVSKIEGVGREWRVTLAGNGLGAGAYLEIAFKAGSVPVKFVGPGSLTFLTFTNEGDAGVPVIAFFFAGKVVLEQVLLFGADAPAVTATNGIAGAWRVTLDGDGLAPGALIGLVVDGTAGVRRIVSAGIVAVAL